MDILPKHYKQLLQLKSLLDDFCPQEQSEVEKSLDLTDLRNAVEILQKAQKLVGGENED